MNTSTPSGWRRRQLLALGTGLLALAAAPAHAIDWPWAERIKGDGQVRQQTRSPGAFKGIALNLPAQVELRLGSTDSVTVETDANLLPLIETVVEQGILEIRPARRNVSLQPRGLKIVVQARQIEQVAIAGGGSVSAGALRAPRLRFEIGGSGTIEVGKVESDALAVEIGGSGNVRAGGATHKLSVAIAGSGQVQARELRAQEVTVDIGGSGQAEVWAQERLTASLAGSGNVDYYGDPVLSSSVAGSGRTRRLAAAP